jgi:hypothetical protein
MVNNVDMLPHFMFHENNQIITLKHTRLAIFGCRSESAVKVFNAMEFAIFNLHFRKYNLSI